MSGDGSCATATEEEERDFAFDSSDFNDVVKTKAFVDKTLLIKAIFHDSPKIEINAPRGFGKSTNMDMLKRFLEIQVDECGAAINRGESSNYEIFKGHNLLIYREQHFFDEIFATYPVIYVDFKPVTGNSYDEILDKFRFSLHETFKLHSYLLQSDKLDSEAKQKLQMFCGEKTYFIYSYCSIQTDVIFGLKFLSKCLYKHFDDTKVFLLIDEYDAPVNNTMETNVLAKVNGLLGGLLCAVLKENECVHRAVLTGVSSFAEGSSVPNNLKRYTFLSRNPFAKFYGLTEPEVDGLLYKFKIDNKMKVKSYYDGYCGVNNEKLFSTCSVLHYLQNKELKSYWQPCDIISKLKNALTFTYLRYAIEELCLQNYLEIELPTKKYVHHVSMIQNICLGASDHYVKPDTFLSFLLERGYLTYEKVLDVPARRYIVKIPNSEIFEQLQEQLKEFYGPSVNSCLDACADIFKEISSSSEDGIFQDFVSKFSLLLKELHFKAIKKSKVTCRYLLFTIFGKAKYSIRVELHALEGNPYLIVKDRLGIIIEVRYAPTADVALKDITEKYVNVIVGELGLKNVTEKIYIGLNVNENNTANMTLCRLNRRQNLLNCIQILDDNKVFT